MHALRGNTGVEWYPERGFFPVLRMFWRLSMREYQPSTSCAKNITVSQTIALWARFVRIGKGKLGFRLGFGRAM